MAERGGTLKVGASDMHRQTWSLLAALLTALVVTLLGILAAPAVAAVPDGFSSVRVADGLSEPTAMAFAPDGRIFVAEQGGKLRIIKNSRLLREPFLEVNADARGERGLLGVALDPGFANNHHVYVYYTAKSPRVHNRVARYTARGDVAVPGSRKIILELDNLSSAQNHNGGAIHFGVDGKLYVAVGDNADGENAQSLRTLKGKMLRIDKSGSIPADNPFYDRASGKTGRSGPAGCATPSASP